MSTINTSLTALKAYGTVQEVISNNVANVNTDNYNARRTSLEELPENNGVRVQEIREKETNINGVQNQQSNIQNNQQSNIPQNNVDLTEEFTKMVQNQNAYNANAQMVRVQDQMVGELVNKLV